MNNEEGHREARSDARLSAILGWLLVGIVVTLAGACIYMGTMWGPKDQACEVTSAP